MRVILAEDEPLYRELLVHMLASNGFEVIAQAGGLDEVIALTDADPPDLVLLDIRMPPSHTDEGVRAALQIRARHPQVALVLLSQYGEVEYATQIAQELGTRAGYLSKQRATGIEALLDAIGRVLNGELMIDSEVIAKLLQRRRVDNPLDRLTERELETLALIAEGRSNAAVAQRMHITVAAVERYISNIRQKLDLRLARNDSARVLLVLTYLRHTGQLDLDLS